MPIPTKFQIAKSVDKDQLVKFVNDWLRDGYQLYGELKVLHITPENKHSHEFLYVQALVKYA